MQRHVYHSTDPVRAFLIVDHADEWDGRVYESSAAFRLGEDIPRFCVFRGVPGVEVARLAIELGDAVYVDDEVDEALSDGPWHSNPIRLILKRGRHLKNARGEVSSVSAMLATHRPANLPTDIVSLMRRVYVGKMQSFADAERIYREGWLPEATSALDARRILDARNHHEFSVWPS